MDKDSIILDDMPDISPEKFAFRSEGADIKDEIFETKPVSYLEDALTRFRKNKSSVTAFFIILAIIIMSIIGPMISGYGYNEQNRKFQNMPPKIPVLEKIGIGNGSRTLANRRVEKLSDPNEYPEGSILWVSKPKIIQKI